MAISIETVREIVEDSNPYKLFIYKSLNYISTEELINIDPRTDTNKFYDVPKIENPLLYEYPSDGSTKFIVMALYKIMNDDNSSILSTVFRSDDYYDSALFAKMKINIVVKGIIKDEFTISQIRVQMLDHNNMPYIAHGVDGQLDDEENVITNGLVTPSLTANNPNKIHYNKDLTRLINATNYINPQKDITVRGSNVIVDNNTVRKIAYVNTLEDGESPIIYNNDYVGQLLASANVLSETVMQQANILICDGTFVDQSTYPELYDEIGDIYLFDIELWAKIVEVGGTVAEMSYADAVSSGKEDLIVELFNVQIPAAPQDGKFKLPSKEYLGYFDNYEYYIKYQSSLNTLNAKLLDTVNGVGIVNNEITLTTTDIPQGTNLYFKDSLLDPIRQDIADINNLVPRQPALSVAGVQPYLEDEFDNTDPDNPILIKAKGDVPLTSNDIGAASQQYVNDSITNLGLENYLTKNKTQIDLINITEYPEVIDDTDPENPIISINKYIGFHLDSNDLFYEKDIDKNPNDPDYNPQSVHDVIAGILDDLANNNGAPTEPNAIKVLVADTSNYQVGQYRVLNKSNGMTNANGVRASRVNDFAVFMRVLEVIENESVTYGLEIPSIIKATSTDSLTVGQFAQWNTDGTIFYSSTQFPGEPFTCEITNIDTGTTPSTITMNVVFTDQILLSDITFGTPVVFTREFLTKVSSVNGKVGEVILVESDIPSIGTTYQKLLPTSDVNINNKKLINVAAPTSGTDASTKAYTDLRALKSALVEIPITETTIANNGTVNLNLGAPTLLKGAGVIGDYVTVSSNNIKIVKTLKSLQMSGIVLGDFAASLAGTADMNFYLRRPATVTAPGTTANDIIHRNTRVKIGGNTLGDTEFSFKTSYINTNTDPFFIDGFVLTLNNLTGESLTTVASKAGTSTISALRILFLD